LKFKLVFTFSILTIIASTSYIIPADATHDNPANRDKSAYLFRIAGAGGDMTWGNNVDDFVRDNNGVVHHSQYNWFFHGATDSWTDVAGQGNLPQPKTANIHDASTDTGGCRDGNPPAAQLGHPRGWTQIVTDYVTHLHSNSHPELHANHPAKVIMMGHSFGAAATAFVVSDPRNQDIVFDHVFLSDPVGPNGNRINVLFDVGYEHSPEPCQATGLSVPPCISIIAFDLIGTPFSYAICQTHGLDNRVINDNVLDFRNIYQLGGAPPLDNAKTCPVGTKCSPTEFFIPPPALFVSCAHKFVGQPIPPGLPPCNFVSIDTDNEPFHLIMKPDALREYRQIQDNRPCIGIPDVLLGGCHGRVTSFTDGTIDRLKLMNTKPSFEREFPTPNPITINEGDTGIVQFTAVDQKTQWESPTNMDLKYTAFNDDPLLDVTENQGNKFPFGAFITRAGTVDIDAIDDTQTEILVQVEDNGFPCDNCIIDANAMGAKGKWARTSVDVTVLNVPPTPVLIGDSETDTILIDLTFNAVDPGPLDQAAGFSYEIEWWDGTKETLPESGLTTDDVNFQRSMQEVGTFEVKITATDKDGDGGTTTIDVTFGSPPIGGEMINVDSTALILTGSQMTAAWMIPVIVSAIGIGIVIARKF